MIAQGQPVSTARVPGWHHGLVRFVVLVAAFATTLLLAACGTGAGSATPATASPSAGSPSIAAPTSGPPGTASASPSGPAASPSSNLVVPHDDPGLEALLPDEVDGVTLFKLSVGIVSSVSNEGAAAIVAMAKDIGDGSGNFGLAYAADAPANTFNLFALRVPKASTNDLLTEYTRLTLAQTAGGTAESATLGGRSLVHIIDPGSAIGDVWFYGKGDTVYGVQAGSPEAAEELLSLLP